jgi:distribution and morphology protein 31
VSFHFPLLYGGRRVLCGLTEIALPDRRHVFWDTTKPLVPADFRHPSKTGDFELDNLEIEDFLVTVHQPSNQRPFNVSIFNAQIGPFRKRWMFYDLMSAVGITGQYDNCLFSLHKPQKLGKSSTEEKDERIKRLARFRIDGLPIEHAQYATGFQGPMSWITSGKLDAVLDVQFPRHPDEDVDLSAILNHLGKNVADLAKEAGVIGDTEEPVDIQPIEQDDRLDVRTSAEAVQNAAIAATSLAKRNPQEEAEIIPGQHRLARPALRAPGTEPSTGIWDWAANLQKDMQESLQEREVKIDIDLRFRDIKAAVPLYTTDLSVSNNAFIRPIVAFMK